MPLYSSGTDTTTDEGKRQNGTGENLAPEDKNTPNTPTCSDWCYLFVHTYKLEAVKLKVEQIFKTFIHQTAVKDKKSGAKNEQITRPTIAKLLFIQGFHKKIQAFLNLEFPGLYLTKDCSTKQTAIIANDVMVPFMQLAEANPTRIRFMPNSIEHYATNHTLVKITSGALSGLEGYLMRISRDKCLVTTLGGMTIAIGGVHKESFENLEDSPLLRNTKHKDTNPQQPTSPLQEIANGFFKPENQLDWLALVHHIERWSDKARQTMEQTALELAANMVNTLLHHMSKHIFPLPASLPANEAQTLKQCQKTLRQMQQQLQSGTQKRKEMLS